MTLLMRGGAELIGTALLVAVVIGSGIMAQSLTADVGVSLLLNQLATILGLGVLIVMLLPLSGAHFNPVVTAAFALRRQISPRDALAYVGGQLVGGMAGVALAHVMFGRALWEVSAQDRLTPGTFVAEIIATTGLVTIILLLVKQGRTAIIPVVVPAWIGAGYVFTSSTSFANPAVTLGRMFTDSFTGIEPFSGLGFMGAQIVGMLVALALAIPVMAAQQKKA
jgi:glycerol uptake facilitator-like aquaporin